MNETVKLAEFITNIKYSDLSEDVIEKTKGLLLDQLGCQLAFAKKPWCESVYNYCRDRVGRGEASTVVHYGLHTIAEDAAFTNAVFGHGFEMDDTHLNTASHPGVAVIPSALAIGEMKKSSGKDFIKSIVAGYDVFIRIGTASVNMMNRGFHTTGVVGLFGAAAATGSLLDLDRDMLVNALGIAASNAGGISEYAETGGSVKRLHAGFAAQGGVRAALLAQYGLTGPSTTLEGRKGFCQSYADDYSIPAIIADLGKPFRIIETGNKPYCCCAAQHSTIDAVEILKKENKIIAEEVDKITVHQGIREARVVGTIIEPTDITSAQFSGRFGVAMRLIKGSNGFVDYNEKNIKDPDILSLAKKVSYVNDEDFAKLTVKTAPSRVNIKLKNGNEYEKQVDSAKGTLQNPMTKDELSDKFRDLASTVMSLENSEKIIQAIEDLEKLDDINKLSSLLVADKYR